MKSEESGALSVGDIDIIEVSREKGFSTRFVHGRQKHAFLYTERGEMCYKLKNNSIRAEAGALVFMPRGTVHESEYAADDTRVRIVQFVAVGGIALPSEPTLLCIDGTSRLIGGFFEAAEPLARIRCLCELLEVVRGVTKTTGLASRIEPALTAMRARFPEKIQITEYAALCHLSAAHFRRLFHEKTGMTPIEYIKSLRLAHARGLLGGAGFSVEEAAASSGFDNLSYFCRAYRARYGTTPGQDRSREDGAR